MKRIAGVLCALAALTTNAGAQSFVFGHDTETAAVQEGADESKAFRRSPRDRLLMPSRSFVWLQHD